VLVLRLCERLSYPHCSGTVGVINRLTPVAVVEQPTCSQALHTQANMSAVPSVKLLQFTYLKQMPFPHAVTRQVLGHCWSPPNLETEDMILCCLLRAMAYETMAETWFGAGNWRNSERKVIQWHFVHNECHIKSSPVRRQCPLLKLWCRKVYYSLTLERSINHRNYIAGRMIIKCKLKRNNRDLFWLLTSSALAFWCSSSSKLYLKIQFLPHRKQCIFILKIN
jgi:hypothetical protein